MLSEMESKFGRLSEVLITELQQRDLMASQLDTKNGFIAALLRVQTLKHLSSITTSDNTMKGLRSRSRTWSLSSSGKAAKPPEEKSSGKVRVSYCYCYFYLAYSIFFTDLRDIDISFWTRLFLTIYLKMDSGELACCSN